MGSVRINDVEVDVDPKSNIIQAAQQAGVEIPYYCWHHDLSVVASCRMCLVEVGEKKPDGTVSMFPKLVPACQTPAKPGTVVITDSDKVKKSREQTLEYLLLNHPLDCSICDQAGECYLQDYTYKFGRAHSRLNEPKVQRLDKYHIGDQIALFTDRCVMCTRCVRFTREISGTSELHVVNRGSVEEIDVFPGHECNNKLAGNVVDLCPVGALCSKDFLYKKRVWWLKSANSVCTGCSTGCSIDVDQNEDKIFRLRPRENPQAQGSFMCDEGRFGWKYVNSEDRLLAPRKGKLGTATPSPATEEKPKSDLDFSDPWPNILNDVNQAIAEAARHDAHKFVAIFSPFMTCEEAYLLASHLKSINSHIRLVLGPVPVVGADDCYPKGPKGESPAPDKVKFTIRAEKCPNRLGVSAILKHFQGEVIEWSTVQSELAAKHLQSALFVGGYPQPVLSNADVQHLSELRLLIVQDILRSKLTDNANFVLASASFAEREGTVVNHAGLAQRCHAAVRPPAEARADGRILMELAGRRGLFHADSLLQEIGAVIPAFAALKEATMGELGVKALS
ncbi:MAG: (2Fe-2S)-binding protein [Planctomycetaceae bacterium]|nr:(2Fe-2S)-binding protein [Planctomycetaceae bacterium]